MKQSYGSWLVKKDPPALLAQYSYNQCILNGVNYEKLHLGVGDKVTRLETFFFGFPCIPVGMENFPHLRTLCIVNQRFNCMSGLEACPLLEELWICETQAKVLFYYSPNS